MYRRDSDSHVKTLSKKVRKKTFLMDEDDIASKIYMLQTIIKQIDCLLCIEKNIFLKREE